MDSVMSGGVEGADLVPVDQEFLYFILDVMRASGGYRIELTDMDPYHELFLEFTNPTDSAHCSLFLWFNEKLHKLEVVHSLSNTTDFSAAKSGVSQPMLTFSIYYFVRLETMPADFSDWRNHIQMGTVSPCVTESLLNAMNSVYSPWIRSFNTWPSSVRDDFLSQIERYMASLTETTYLAKGRTVLYIPSFEDLDPVEGSRNKELIPRLESLVVHWTRQIKELLSGVHSMARTSMTAQQVLTSGPAPKADDASRPVTQFSKKTARGLNACATKYHPFPRLQDPLDELCYWKTRAADLTAVLDQLRSRALCNVIETLKLAHSQYADTFDELAAVIKERTNESMSNLKFLGTIEDACRSLTTTKDLNDIASVLPDLLCQIKLISAQSTYYSNVANLSGLLRRVSSLVVNSLVSMVSLYDIFVGDSLRSIHDLIGCNAIINSWILLYKQACDNTKEHEDLVTEIEAAKKAAIEAEAQMGALPPPEPEPVPEPDERTEGSEDKKDNYDNPTALNHIPPHYHKTIYCLLLRKQRPDQPFVEWSFDSSVVSSAEAFGQRCIDLCEICQDRLQFSRADTLIASKDGFLQRHINANAAAEQNGKQHIKENAFSVTPKTDIIELPNGLTVDVSLLSQIGKPPYDNLNTASLADINSAEYLLPKFGGSLGQMIRRSFREIQRTFLRHLALLSRVPYNHFDVRSNSWHESVAAYRQGIKALTIFTENIISTNFSQSSHSVVETCAILEAFSHLSSRPAFKRSVEKKTLDTVRLFIEKAGQIKSQFELLRTASNTTNLETKPSEARDTKKTTKLAAAKAPLGTKARSTKAVSGANPGATKVSTKTVPSGTEEHLQPERKMDADQTSANMATTVAHSTVLTFASFQPRIAMNSVNIKRLLSALERDWDALVIWLSPGARQVASELLNRERRNAAAAASGVGTNDSRQTVELLANYSRDEREAIEIYAKTKALFESYIDRNFREWVSSIKSYNFEAELEKPIMALTPIPDALKEKLNVDSALNALDMGTPSDKAKKAPQAKDEPQEETTNTILLLNRVSLQYPVSIKNCLQEVMYWSKLGYDIPENAKQLYSRRTALHQKKELVSLCVSEVNRVVDNLAPDEILLFRSRLSELSNYLSDAWTKIGWNTRGLLQFIMKARKLAIEAFALTCLFHNKRKTIEDCIRSLSSISLINCKFCADTSSSSSLSHAQSMEQSLADDDDTQLGERSSTSGPLQLSEFVSNQRVTLESATRQFFETLNLAEDSLVSCYNIFRKDGPSVQAEWIQFVSQIESRIEVSLLALFVQSFEELAFIMTGRRSRPLDMSTYKPEAIPIFKLFLVLTKHPIISPSVDELNSAIVAVLRSAILGIVERIERFHISLSAKEHRLREMRIAEAERIFQEKIDQREREGLQTSPAEIAVLRADIDEWTSLKMPEYKVRIPYLDLFRFAINILDQPNNTVTVYLPNSCPDDATDQQTKGINTNALGHAVAWIRYSLDAVCKQATTYAGNFARYSELWLEDMRGYEVRHNLLSQPLSVYEDALKSFQRLEADLQQEESHIHLSVIQLDCTNLKAELARKSADFQSYLIDVLQEKAFSELKLVTNDLNEMILLLDKESRDLDDLQRQITNLDSAKVLIGSINERCQPIGQKFQLLMTLEANVSADKLVILNGLTDLIAKAKGAIDSAQLKVAVERTKFRDQVTRDQANLTQACMDLKTLVQSEGPYSPNVVTKAIEGVALTAEDIQQAERILHRFENKYDDLLQLKEQVEHGLKIFQAEFKDVKELSIIQGMIKQLKSIWSIASAWNNYYSSVKRTQMRHIDHEQLDAEIKKNQISVRKLPNDTKAFPVSKTLALQLEEYRPVPAVSQDLKNTAMRPRHWAQISEITGIYLLIPKDTPNILGPASGGEPIAKLSNLVASGVNLDSSTTSTGLSSSAVNDEAYDKVIIDPDSIHFTLHFIISSGLMVHAESIAAISSGATQELFIEEGMRDIVKKWHMLELNVATYQSKSYGGDIRNKPTYYILKGLEDLFANLEEHSLSISTMKGSKYARAFEQELDTWDAVLSQVSEGIEIILNSQRAWMYLETIFAASDDIRKQLPAESQLFDEANELWKKSMTRIYREKRVLVCFDILELLQTNIGSKLNLRRSSVIIKSMLEISQTLDQIQKRLEDYLERKRVSFPRFYFLSNDELLEILAQSKNPLAVQPHIRKCFDAMKSLDVTDKTGTNISQYTDVSQLKPNTVVIASGMRGDCGELVPFLRNIICTGVPVEVWLGQVEDCMRATLKDMAPRCLLDMVNGKLPLEILLGKWPGQLTIASNQIRWTQHVAHALSSGAKFLDKTKLEAPTLRNKKDTFDKAGEDGLEDGDEAAAEEPQEELNDEAFLMQQLMQTPGFQDCLDTVRRNLKNARKRSMIFLSKLTEIVRKQRSEFIVPQAAPYPCNFQGSLIQNKVRSHITLEVHNRDIIEELYHAKVYNDQCFEWFSQLKYYLELVGSDFDQPSNKKKKKEEKREDMTMCIVIRQTTSILAYQYEYLANTGRLVCTPLTDRCYVTLTSALQLRKGGAPQGPAGTGKTETTKDLAKAISIQCLIFNCSEGLDYKSLGRMFSGLCQTGAWSCFDEFNRLYVDVLSVVAQQVGTILAAISKNASRFVFEGREISLKRTCGVFITMNPGYAGRSELPDNLKALFRPISMCVPQMQLICEIMILSEGFATAKSLGMKAKTLFELSNLQLSKQGHYDFGLRAMKAVLLTAGMLKRSHPEYPEDMIMMRSLKYSTEPKLVRQDTLLFTGLISDLFPGVELQDVSYGLVEAGVDIEMAVRNIQINTKQRDKIFQFLETQESRHGVMVIGNSGSGKTTCYEVLAAARARAKKAYTEYLEATQPKQGAVQSKALLKNPYCIMIKHVVDSQEIPFKAVSPYLYLLQKLYKDETGTSKHIQETVYLAKCIHYMKEVYKYDPSTGTYTFALTRDQKDTAAGDASVEPVYDEKVRTPYDDAYDVVIDYINPKALNINQLYGAFDMATQEWVDGVVSNCIRSSSALGNDPNNKTYYTTLFDGPVDTLWIESLNSVLDDSKILTLVNGERISFPKAVNFLFEANDLSQASPATVSRAGMIYCDISDIEWRWLYKHGIDTFYRSKTRNELVRERYGTFQFNLERAIAKVKENEGDSSNYKELVKHDVPAETNQLIVDTLEGYGMKLFNRIFDAKEQGILTQSIGYSVYSMMRTFFNMFEALAQPHNGVWIDIFDNDGMVQRVIEMYIVFSLVWAFGGSLDSDGRQHFDLIIREVEGALPVADTVWDYKVDHGRRSWVHWNEVLPRGWRPNPAIPLYSTLVPTVDTLRTEYVVKTAILHAAIESIENRNYHTVGPANNYTTSYGVMLYGVSGTGKTSIFKNIIIPALEQGLITNSAYEYYSTLQVTCDGATNLEKMFVGGNIGKYNIVSLGLSAQTSPQRLQAVLESRLQPRSTTSMGPVGGKRLLAFFDDYNLPQRDTFGSQPPLEFMRQVMDRGTMYRQKKDKYYLSSILDVDIVPAMAVPGGGRNPICARNLSLFSIFGIDSPSENVLKGIFHTLLSVHFALGFDEQIRQMVDTLVTSGIEIYTQVSSSLLPTPLKPHYVFNLRDLSKFFLSLMKADPQQQTTQDSIVRLWTHECLRVYHDRLVETDRPWFFDLLSSKLGNHFNTTLSRVFYEKQPPLFVDFLETKWISTIPNSQDPDTEVGVFQEITSKKMLKTFMEEKLREYNNSGAASMNLVLFNDAIDHCCRIARILSSPSGHALLIGSGGSGRSSMTRLAAHLQRQTVFSIDLAKNYVVAQFREDMKKLFLMAGVDNQAVCFLLSDQQIADEAFLEDVNSILSSGEIPGLFTQDEMSQIRDALSPICKQYGMSETMENCYQMLLQRSKVNLHIVLAFSPSGEVFRRRLRMFPSLVGSCTLDLFGDWPTSALEEVALYFLSDFKELDEFENMQRVLEIDENGNIVEEKAQPPANAARGGSSQNSSRDESDATDPTRMSLRRKLAKAFVTAHDVSHKTALEMELASKRKVHVTPAGYLSLVRLYRDILLQQRHKITSDINKLKGGINKLMETRETVEEMRKELETTKVVVLESQENCENLLANIAIQQREIDEKQRLIQIDSEKLMKEKEVLMGQMKEAQKDLDEATPALEAAQKALESLDSKDIYEIRSFTQPPELVKLVLAGVMTLLNRDTDYKSAKIVMGEGQFLEKLINYDVNNIPETMLKKVKRYYMDKNYTVDAIGRVSVAGKSLCLWVRAVYEYACVYKVVKPKQDALEDAKNKLAEKERALQAAQDELARIAAAVEKLKSEHASAVAERDRLRRLAEELALKLNRAEKLISGLGGEKERWTKKIQTLTYNLSSLPGDCLTAAAFISYAGGLTGRFRSYVLTEWVNAVNVWMIPCTDPEKYSVSEFLAGQALIYQWSLLGLPKDNFSAENGILITTSNRTPLIIDPQRQATRWIKKLFFEAPEYSKTDVGNVQQGEESEGGTLKLEVGAQQSKKSTKQSNNPDENLKIINAKDADAVKQIEMCIQYGTPVLLEDVGEQIDPSLDVIIRKDIIKKQGRRFIKIRDKEVEWNDNFRIFVSTRLPNPLYTPEVFAKACIINFTIIKEGLTDQLLGAVVSKERPDLEESKNKIVLNTANMRVKLQFLEDEILRLLATSSGSLLDDEELIATLENSKVTSAEITKQLETSAITEKKIDMARRAYQPVSERASLLYFVLEDLGSVDPMYQFSLEAYMKLFINSINNSQKHEDVSARIRLLNEYHTYAVYKYCCRGLFTRHKILLSLHMCVKILESYGRINMNEYAFLLKGGQVFDKSQQPPNPDPTWISGAMWDSLCILDKMPAFNNLLPSIEQRLKDWYTNYYVHDTPEKAPLIGEWDTQLNELQKMLVLRCFRPDRLINAIYTFVANSIGAQYTNPPPFDLGLALADSSPQIPLLFILSQGADPTSQLLAFAKSCGRADKLDQISLGQGQQEVAVKAVQRSMKEGRWVLLANVHLTPSFFSVLEQLVEDIPHSAPHKDFRLWISSDPTSVFPISVLQTSIKITTEAPSGVRANLQQLYTYIDKPILERLQVRDSYHVPQEEQDNMFSMTPDEKDDAYRKLLFGISFYHTLLVERRKFGSLGYNIQYQFTQSDYETAVEVLSMYLQLYDTIPWNALKYLVASIIYGGRVIDDLDRRVLNVYIDHVFCQTAIKRDGYLLAPPLSEYVIPQRGSLQEYRDYITTLPQVDLPAVFGQHSNSEVASRKVESLTLVETLLTIQSMDGSSSGEADDKKKEKEKKAKKTTDDDGDEDGTKKKKKESTGLSARDERIIKLAQDIIHSLPAPITNLPPPITDINDQTAPLKAVLLQESERHMRLRNIISDDLTTLQRGIRGLTMMSAYLDEVLNDLQVGKVPASWGIIYKSTKSLAPWSRDFIKRVEQLQKWANVGSLKSYWLGGLSLPTAFLTALQQQASRRMNIAIDQLEWGFQVTRYLDPLRDIDDKSVPAFGDGFYAHDCYLEGANWDLDIGYLKEPRLMDLYLTLPIIRFKPQEAKKKTAKFQQVFYECPCYYYPVRTGSREQPSFVINIWLHSGYDKPAKWVKRGTAILLNLGD
ncbi:Dynein heavy chain [Giardia lamblia P15]|uniref:Dynein heavy chain n=1 Tax=Giardia intestinalis (strain P15) TaxID=658858 RepID=E1F1F0_GIAIA|nr:Dynein heavy chain [Giardia lamblia P15]